MTAMLLAAFDDSVRFAEAARHAKNARYPVLDAYTPFPVEAVREVIEHRRSHIRLAMFIGGTAMAALAYGIEYFSAVVNYPYNAGGRPLDAWPAFMLVPFATGILVAAIAGFAAFLIETGLPRLHDRLFAVEGFERVSQDRFVLALSCPQAEDEKLKLMAFLRHTGAAAIREIER
jgi:Protein of unknown function (DUF3341)